MHSKRLCCSHSPGNAEYILVVKARALNLQVFSYNFLLVAGLIRDRSCVLALCMSFSVCKMEITILIMTLLHFAKPSQRLDEKSFLKARNLLILSLVHCLKSFMTCFITEFHLLFFFFFLVFFLNRIGIHNV